MTKLFHFQVYTQKNCKNELRNMLSADVQLLMLAGDKRKKGSLRTVFTAALNHNYQKVDTPQVSIHR